MIVTLDRRTEWNRMVAACPHGDVLQCWEWGELKARTGWTPLPVGVERGGRLAAGCLLLKRPVPGRLSLLYAPRGPIVDLAQADLWAELAAEMRAVARRERAIVIKIDPAIPGSAGFQPALSEPPLLQERGQGVRLPRLSAPPASAPPPASRPSPAPSRAK